MINSGSTHQSFQSFVTSFCQIIFKLCMTARAWGWIQVICFGPCAGLLPLLPCWPCNLVVPVLVWVATHQMWMTSLLECYQDQVSPKRLLWHKVQVPQQCQAKCKYLSSDTKCCPKFPWKALSLLYGGPWASVSKFHPEFPWVAFLLGGVRVVTNCTSDTAQQGSSDACQSQRIFTRLLWLKNIHMVWRCGCPAFEPLKKLRLELVSPSEAASDNTAKQELWAKTAIMFTSVTSLD